MTKDFVFWWEYYTPELVINVQILNTLNVEQNEERYLDTIFYQQSGSTRTDGNLRKSVCHTQNQK